MTINVKQIALMPSRMLRGTSDFLSLLAYRSHKVANTITPTPIENQGLAVPPRAALETGP
jgi:hypothetical protein